MSEAIRMAKIAEAEYARALKKPECNSRVLVSKPAPASGAQRPSGAWTDDSHRINMRIFSPTDWSLGPISGDSKLPQCAAGPERRVHRTIEIHI